MPLLSIIGRKHDTGSKYYSHCSNFSSCDNICALSGAILEEHPKATTGTECSGMDSPFGGICDTAII